MTDATRGLARWVVGDARTKWREHPSGDWVRYEDAARIQRARARNLVERIRERAARLTTAVEGGRITRPQLFRRLRYDFEACMAAELAYSDRLHARADRITAKYLKEGT